MDVHTLKVKGEGVIGGKDRDRLKVEGQVSWGSGFSVEEMCESAKKSVEVIQQFVGSQGVIASIREDVKDKIFVCNLAQGVDCFCLSLFHLK